MSLYDCRLDVDSMKMTIINKKVTQSYLKFLQAYDMDNIVTILPLKVLLLTLFCLGTVAHHSKINQICNILYFLIHQEPVSAFEKEKQGNKKFTPNSTQFV